MKDLVDLALERARAGNGEKGKGGAPRRSPAMSDALKEAWESMEKKDFDGFAEAFQNAVRIHSADESAED